MYRINHAAPPFQCILAGKKKIRIVLKGPRSVAVDVKPYTNPLIV
jgi:hypothetical protein